LAQSPPKTLSARPALRLQAPEPGNFSRFIQASRSRCPTNSADPGCASSLNLLINTVIVFGVWTVGNSRFVKELVDHCRSASRFLLPSRHIEAYTRDIATI
jgi:hypothetical protein